MKATHHIALASGLVLTLALGGAASPLGAQGATRTISRDPRVDAVLVTTFRSTNRTLGVKAAETLRDQLFKDSNRGKALWAIPTADVKNNLEPAGFPYDQPISTNDARLLATQFRADEFVEGRVEEAGGSVRVNARLVSTNDARNSQPLPAVEAKRLDHAMADVSKHIYALRRIIPQKRQCENLVRDQKYQEALVPARAAIAAYPQSTWARICLASAMQYLKMPADSVLPVVSKVLEIDSLNYHALAMASGAYETLGDTNKSTELLVTLLSTDPTNVALSTSVVNKLAQTRNFGPARRIIDKAVADNPGDPDLIRLQFRILTATENWKEAIAAGESLIRTDTSATDTTFFPVLASAYANDSQPQKAAEAVALGIAKYPQNAMLHLLHSQFLRSAGQLPQSVVAARRALQLNPNMPNANIAYLTVAQTFIDLQQFDSVGAVLRTAASVAKTADDSSKVAAFALQQGQRNFQAGRGDTADASRAVPARQQMEQSIRWFALADSLAPSPAAKFQQGLAAFTIAQNLVNREIVPNAKTLGKDGLCTLGNTGKQYTTMAQLMMQRGGSFNAQAAGQIMNAAMTQMSPYFDQVIKSSCK